MGYKKPKLTVELLITEAEQFCISTSQIRHEDIVGVTDGKAVVTYIEHSFEEILVQKYSVVVGSSARGIDLPDPEVNTDIKTTSITQPQSSYPLKTLVRKSLAWDTICYSSFIKRTTAKKRISSSCMRGSLVKAEPQTIRPQGDSERY